MEIHKVRPHIWGIIPKGTVIAQVGCNIGIIHTAEGIIVVDTSISIKRMGEILDAAGVSATDVCRVIYTHMHADHINGNSLFSCPVICHSKAKARMAKKCAKLGQELITFDSEYELSVGDVKMRLIHTGGHTPESIVVWLPEDKVLFSGDLIFSGRAPFLASVTNFNDLVKALKWLPTLGADVIIPGHGPLCDDDEIMTQTNYLESTREVVKGHFEQGDSLVTIYKDPNLPKMEGANFERNVEWIYKRLTK
jgi:cyclase